MIYISSERSYLFLQWHDYSTGKFMTLEEYNSMDEQSKYILWLAQAREVAAYQKEGIRHVLYQLDAFYIEWSSFLHQQKKAWFSAFNNTRRLEPYLEKIAINI